MSPTFRGHRVVDEAAWVILERNRERWRPLVHTVRRTRSQAMEAYQWSAPAGGPPPAPGVTDWYRVQRRNSVAIAVRCAIEPDTVEGE